MPGVGVHSPVVALPTALSTGRNASDSPCSLVRRSTVKLAATVPYCEAVTALCVFSQPTRKAPQYALPVVLLRRACGLSAPSQHLLRSHRQPSDLGVCIQAHEWRCREGLQAPARETRGVPCAARLHLCSAVQPFDTALSSSSIYRGCTHLYPICRYRDRYVFPTSMADEVVVGSLGAPKRRADSDKDGENTVQMSRPPPENSWQAQNNDV